MVPYMWLLLSSTFTLSKAVITSVSERENVWVTWAHQANRSDFCLAMASAADPFCTCLIGMPWISLEDTFQKWVTDIGKINEEVEQQMQNKLGRVLRLLV